MLERRILFLTLVSPVMILRRDCGRRHCDTFSPRCSNTLGLSHFLCFSFNPVNMSGLKTACGGFLKQSLWSHRTGWCLAPSCSSSSWALWCCLGKKMSRSLGRLHPSSTPVCVWHSLCLAGWDFLTCDPWQSTYSALSVQRPLLLYRADGSSKALTQKPDNHFTVSYTFILFQSSLSSPVSHLLLISPCFPRSQSLNGWIRKIGIIEEAKYFLDSLCSPQTIFSSVFIRINPPPCCDDLISARLFLRYNTASSSTPTCLKSISHFKQKMVQKQHKCISEEKVHSALPCCCIISSHSCRRDHGGVLWAPGRQPTTVDTQRVQKDLPEKQVN